MKFAFFDEFRPGVVRDGKVYDLSGLLYRAEPHRPQDAVELLVTQFEELKPQIEAIATQGTGIPLERVRLRAPVPRPAQLLCAIRNYVEPGRTPEKGLFLKAPTSIIGDGDTVHLPKIQASVFHHEAELMVVLRRGGYNIPASEAMDYVFGYTGFIDVSAREAGNSFHMRKSYATFGPMGPFLVTADEIPDPHNLRVRFWVNDKLRQDYSTSDMATRIDSLIELASSIAPVLPGDVIATGTHHTGLGPLQDGDRVTMETERIGRLSVTVEDPLKRHWDIS